MVLSVATSCSGPHPHPPPWPALTRPPKQRVWGKLNVRLFRSDCNSAPRLNFGDVFEYCVCGPLIPILKHHKIEWHGIFKSSPSPTNYILLVVCFLNKYFSLSFNGTHCEQDLALSQVRRPAWFVPGIASSFSGRIKENRGKYQLFIMFMFAYHLY